MGIQTSMSLMAHAIVKQHTRVCEGVMGDALKQLGLWDGKPATKKSTARGLTDRVVLREHHGQLHITEIVIDGVRRCTIITSVEFTEDMGIAAVTSAKGEP